MAVLLYIVLVTVTIIGRYRNLSPQSFNTISIIVSCSGRYIKMTTLKNDTPAASGGDFDVTEGTGTRSDGHKQSWNSADGCGEDRTVI